MSLPIVKSKGLEKILLKLGFIKTRQKGSHAFYKHHDGRYTVIPHHPSRDLSPILVLKILKEINLSRKEFERLV
ncbi:MAG: hypothetical protein A3B68_07685 [Candidatus Melainabacteria bacterium RIFCSPHIGHO2_02_FULL_34_12]|nr:MAG: hypothetical protein A3B68_07685 [Candidatus Melainabacteria bacterium RIFCSPHIGHO2_02_FULL_34_12]